MAEVSSGAVTIVLDDAEMEALRVALQRVADDWALSPDLYELAEAIGVVEIDGEEEEK
jgi:hypothetical protein